jgi:hypothetical protein
MNSIGTLLPLLPLLPPHPSPIHTPPKNDGPLSFKAKIISPKLGGMKITIIYFFFCYILFFY